MATTSAPASVPAWHKPLFGINALIAIFGTGLSFILTILGTYPSVNTVPSMLGNPEQGVVGRILDFFTYFTIWSNILVCIIMTMLFLRPNRDGFWFKVFRLDSVLMITVTGIVYNIILASGSHNQGLEVVTNFFEHVLTPIVTFLVFLIAGPRGWINWRIIGASLILPIVWLAWALARGAVIHAYPYGFLDVVTYGYPTVLINVLGVVVFAIILCLIFWGLDALISRLTRSRQPTSA